MLDVLKFRRSCKKYDPERAVETEKIQEIINAGLNAPSAKNCQNAMVVAVTNKEIRDKMSEFNASVMNASGIDPFYGAPVVLFVMGKIDPNVKYDGSIMIENMLLEAYNQGLGACWIHRAKQELEIPEFRELLKSTGLNLEEYEGIGHVVLGYSIQEKYPEKTIKEGRVFWIK